MGRSNAWALDYLRLMFQNIPAPGIGDVRGLLGSTDAGSLYISLHTNDPGADGNQGTSEATYSGYARVAIPRTAEGWAVEGPLPAFAYNAAETLFPECEDDGQKLTHFGIGTAASGSGKLLCSSEIYVRNKPSPFTASNGVAPRLEVGAIEYRALK